MYLHELLILENICFATAFTLVAIEQKLQPFINFGNHLGSHLEFQYLHIPEVILMYLCELLRYENLYFATYFIKLSAIEQKLWAFIFFGGHEMTSFDLDPGVKGQI